MTGDPGGANRCLPLPGTTAGHEAEAAAGSMYGLLTMSELTVLQDVLYSATDDARHLCEIASSDPEWLARYRPLHAELARLFLDVAYPLMVALDRIMSTSAPA